MKVENITSLHRLRCSLAGMMFELKPLIHGDKPVIGWPLQEPQDLNWKMECQRSLSTQFLQSCATLPPMSRWLVILMILKPLLRISLSLQTMLRLLRGTLQPNRLRLTFNGANLTVAQLDYKVLKLTWMMEAITQMLVNFLMELLSLQSLKMDSHDGMAYLHNQ